jgi:hypothetical protein
MQKKLNQSMIILYKTLGLNMNFDSCSNPVSPLLLMPLFEEEFERKCL